MSSVRSVAVRLSADVAGYIADMRRAGAATDQVGSHAGRSTGRLKTMFTTMTTGAAALGIAKVVKDSVALEASYSKTMNVVRATTKSSAKEMADLDRLAMKMGADTSFSANDASQAILELARGGIRPAAIEAGALQGALTLAAAGELEMGDAANIMVKSMGQFNLTGKQAGAVAAALAGGANASSASVQDMAYALSQGGLAAKSVGFSLQETTGILAAFSNNGLEGSDAGTALKTMLDRLQPTTKSASVALRQLGVITKDGTNQFVKSNGEFKSAAEIAELLKKGTEDLTDAEAKRLITQAFGSDAQRAATILAKEGADGIKEMTKATSDQAAADKMAKANMEGTAGALERMHGAIETTELALGKALAPTVADVAETISEDLLPPVTHFIDQMRSGKGAGGRFADSLGNVKDVVKDVAGVVGDAVDAFTKLPDWAQKAVILGGVTAVAAGKLKGVTGLGRGTGPLSGRGGGLLGGVVSRATPVPVFVTNKGFGLGTGLPGDGPGKPGGPGGKPRWRPGRPGLGTAVTGAIIANEVIPDPATGNIAAGAIAGSAFGPFGAAAGGIAGLAYSDIKGGQARSDVLSSAGATYNNQSASVKELTQAYGELKAMLDDTPKEAWTNTETQLLDGLKKRLKTASVGYDDMTKAQKRAVHQGAQNMTQLLATRAAMDKSGMSTKQYNTKLRDLPKKVQTLVETPGAIQSREDVRRLREQYGLTPRQVQTLVQLLGGADAIAAASRLKSVYAGIPRYIQTQAVTLHIDKFERQTGGMGKAAGGAIVGPGTGTSDDIPIMASNGEHMWTAAEVAAAGGHAKVMRLRYLAKSGQLRGFATGGAIGSDVARASVTASASPVSVSLAGANLAGAASISIPGLAAAIDGRIDAKIADYDSYKGRGGVTTRRSHA